MPLLSDKYLNSNFAYVERSGAQFRRRKTGILCVCACTQCTRCSTSLSFFYFSSDTVSIYSRSRYVLCTWCECDLHWCKRNLCVREFSRCSVSPNTNNNNWLCNYSNRMRLNTHTRISEPRERVAAAAVRRWWRVVGDFILRESR